MTWTDERVAELRRLHAAGLSARQIAERLGGVSRNSVIGRTHRDNLPVRRKAFPRQRKPVPAVPPMSAQPKKGRRDRGGGTAANIIRGVGKAAPVAKPPRPIVEPPRPPRPPEEMRLLPLLDLTARACRWPIGEGPFLFCGVDKGHAEPSRSYCAWHSRLAYSGVARCG